MLDTLMWILIGTVPLLAFMCGYRFGKADGIREAYYLMAEQWMKCHGYSHRRINNRKNCKPSYGVGNSYEKGKKND